MLFDKGIVIGLAYRIVGNQNLFLHLYLQFIEVFFYWPFILELAFFIHSLPNISAVLFNSLLVCLDVKSCESSDLFFQFLNDCFGLLSFKGSLVESLLNIAIEFINKFIEFLLSSH